MAAVTSMARKADSRRRTRLKEAVTGYLLVGPVVVAMTVFVFYPLGRTFYLTFFDYSFLEDVQQFVGLRNYIDWFNDPAMWQSLWISVKFFLYYVVSSMLIGLIIAIMIDRLANKYFASLYRTIFYFPVVLPAAIVFTMWLWLYDPVLGLFARVSVGLGAQESPNWLGDPGLALPSLAAMNLWLHIGDTVLFFLIGLAGIPHTYTEAARMDGASESKIIRKVTLPLLAPFIFLVFVLRLKVLEMAVAPLFMTRGGPAGATRTYGLEAYELFHDQGRIGYANTWFVLLAILAVATAAFASRRLRHYQA